MTVNDLMKRLAKMDNDKMILFIHEDGGWSNINIKENEFDVHITEDKNALFEE